MTQTPVRVDRLRSTLSVALTVLLLAGTAYLVVAFMRHAFATPPAVARAAVPLADDIYGLAGEVSVPGLEVTVRTGRPVKYVDYADVASSYEPDDAPDDDSNLDRPERLVAPDDGLLVPITVDFSANDSWGINEEWPPLTVRLRSGEQSVTVVSPPKAGETPTLETRSYAVPVDGAPTLSDLSIEVDYDGVVQRLDPATGDIDTGRAQALYEPRGIGTGCESVTQACRFSAAMPHQPLIPGDVSFTASGVSLYAFDSELGWAEDDTVWAAARVQVFGGYVYDSTGASFYIRPGDTPTRAELVDDEGGVIATSINDLATGTEYGRKEYGRVVFAVPTDVDLSTLVLRQRARLHDDPRRVGLVARIPLS